MKTIDLSPVAYLRGRDAANRYDEDLLQKLAAERERILANKSALGRFATRVAAPFYRGDLGLNQWVTDRTNRHYRANNAE